MAAANQPSLYDKIAFVLRNGVVPEKQHTWERYKLPLIWAAIAVLGVLLLSVINFKRK